MCHHGDKTDQRVPTDMFGTRSSQRDLRSSQISWRRETKKEENFISKNKKLAREPSKRQKAVPLSQPRARRDAGTIRDQPKRQASSSQRKSDSSTIGNDNIVISKKYLEELLSLKLNVGQIQPAVEVASPRSSPPPATKGASTFYQKVSNGRGVDRSFSKREICVEPSSVPGLGGLSSSQETVEATSTGYGNLGFKKPQPLLDGIDSEGYFPWGRPGGGAPLRSSSGNLLVDYRRRSPRFDEHISEQQSSSEEARNQQLGGVAHQVHHSPSAMRTSISFAAGTSDDAAKLKQEEDRRKWLQELNEQILKKKSQKECDTRRGNSWKHTSLDQDSTSLDQHHTSFDQNHSVSDGNHTSIPQQIMYEERSPPKDGHFGRGAGPFVDRFVLEEKQKCRAKNSEHFAFLRAQIEEKERRRKEEQRQRELEERLEEERLAKEQMKLQEELLREQDKQKRKEEEAIRRHAHLQQKILEAGQVPQHIRGSTSKRTLQEGFEGNDSLSLHNGSTVSIVINTTPTTPTRASVTSSSPHRTSEEKSDSYHQSLHSDMRSPSLVMFDDHSSTDGHHSPRRTCDQGLTSKQQSGHTSKHSKQPSEHSPKQQSGHTSKQQSSHTSKQQSGHTSKQQSSHTSKQQSGHTSKQQTGHTSKQQSGHTSKQQSGHTSKQQSKHTSKQQSSHTSKQQSGHTSQQQSSRTSKQQSGHTSKQPSEHTPKQPSEHTSKQQLGHASKRQSGHSSKQQVKKTAQSLVDPCLLTSADRGTKKENNPKPPSSNSYQSPPTIAHQEPPPHRTQSPPTILGTPSPPLPALKHKHQQKYNVVVDGSPVHLQTPPPLLPSETTYELVPPDNETIPSHHSDIHLPKIPPTRCVVGESTHQGTSVLSTLANFKMGLLSAQQNLQLLIAHE